MGSNQSGSSGAREEFIVLEIRLQGSGKEQNDGNFLSLDPIIDSFELD